jgi:hypothetical protein
MNLVKHGLASAFVVSGALLACGSGSDDGNGGGAGSSSAGARAGSAGSSSSNAGRPNSSAGSTSSNGGSTSSNGGSSSGQAGGAPVGSGGCVSDIMDPGEQMCPAAFDCVQTKCKTELDTATSTTGPCASYIQCTNACDCDDNDCISQCTQSSECQASFQAYASCAQSSCITELFSCLGAGGSGAGGSASTAKTCADLNTCCATLTDMAQKTSCTMVADLNTDLLCGLAYSNFCG